MSLISLQNSSELEVTILSNRFIDNFMPRANGEFVKVYIYLLRMVSAAPSSFSLEHMADSLFCTERDISRALKYWESEKLIALTYTADQKLSGITLLEPLRIPVIERAALPWILSPVPAILLPFPRTRIRESQAPLITFSVSLLTGSENLSKTKRSVSFSISQSSI